VAKRGPAREAVRRPREAHLALAGRVLAAKEVRPEPVESAEPMSELVRVVIPGPRVAFWFRRLDAKG
jgi:hypothetical protein